MNLDEKRQQLTETYRDFEEKIAPYKEKAMCKPGCAFCCTHFGSVDITTLEGRLILERVRGLAKKSRTAVEKKIRKNMEAKEKSGAPPCPFLKPDDRTCLIYEVRPFSCRSLYSLEKCEGKGPVVHRQAAALSRETVPLLQKIDSNGYSGHMTYILHLLANRDFFRVYDSGGFNPALISSFGKSHNLVINQAKISAG